MINIIAPINNSIIYDLKPRILVELDSNSTSVIYATLINSKGTFKYSSRSNPELFSKIAFNKAVNFCFTPLDTCYGLNKLYIKYQCNEKYSEYKTLTFNINTIELDTDNNLITTDLYSRLVEITNNILIAYKRPSLSITLPTINESKIYSNYFSIIINALYEVNDYINNNYPGMNRYKIKPFLKSKIKISKSILDSIIDLILNL